MNDYLTTGTPAGPCIFGPKIEECCVHPIHTQEQEDRLQVTRWESNRVRPHPETDTLPRPALSHGLTDRFCPLANPSSLFSIYLLFSFTTYYLLFTTYYLLFLFYSIEMVPFCRAGYFSEF